MPARLAIFGPRRPISLVGPASPPPSTPPAPGGARSPEVPPELLAGRVAGARWGLVQPVTRPTPLTLARREEPHPEPGRVARSGIRPPFGPTPTGRAVAIARGDDFRPDAGGTVRGSVGAPIPRAPARSRVVAAEVQAPAPGAALVARPPTTPLVAQQQPGRALLARAEEPLPFAGVCFTRQRPLVPSVRFPTRSVLARAEEPAPFAGLTLALRARLGNPPPVRTLLVRSEAPLPYGGGVAKLGPAVAPLTRQQMPGRVLVACVEAPQPDWIARGLALVRTGLAAGAIPPSLVGAKPGGRLVRADAGNRSIKRLPRMNATLAYVTRTKTPDEVLAVVFDFSNFPEIVGGATIASAVVSGPGGAALTGLVAGTPAVLTSAATIDSAGNTVASGKGVQVALAGGGAGDDVMVACAATLSTGSRVVVQGKIAVRNAV